MERDSYLLGGAWWLALAMGGAWWNGGIPIGLNIYSGVSLFPSSIIACAKIFCSFGWLPGLLKSELIKASMVMDGVATPLIGFAQDSNVRCCCFRRSYGQCKSWHAVGCAMVLVSFPFVFAPPIGDHHHWNVWLKFGYYAPFVVLFQVGWAAVQVSHLALLPVMSPSQLVRTELLAVRYGFTVGANVTVFIITGLILGISGTNVEFGESHAHKFQIIALISISIGIVFVILFHALVHEDDAKEVFTLLPAANLVHVTEMKNTSKKSIYKRFAGGLLSRKIDHTLRNSSSGNVKEKDWSAFKKTWVFLAKLFTTKNLSTKFKKRKLSIADWMYLPQFYIVGLIYMMTRMSVNLTLVYIPIYLHKSLHLANVTVATVPLAMYVSGFCVALVIKPLTKYLGSQLSYLIGVILSVIGSIFIITLDWDNNQFLRNYGIYGVAVFTGGGASAMLVTSLSIVADLIGTHVGNSAFIYGIMSFTDKLSCGLAVMLINSILLPKYSNNIPEFYRYVLGISCGGSAILGSVGILIVSLILCWNQRNGEEFFDAADEKKQRQDSKLSYTSEKLRGSQVSQVDQDLSMKNPGRNEGRGST